MTSRYLWYHPVTWPEDPVHSVDIATPWVTYSPAAVEAHGIDNEHASSIQAGIHFTLRWKEESNRGKVVYTPRTKGIVWSQIRYPHVWGLMLTFYIKVYNKSKQTNFVIRPTIGWKSVTSIITYYWRHYKAGNQQSPNTPPKIGYRDWGCHAKFVFNQSNT